MKYLNSKDLIFILKKELQKNRQIDFAILYGSIAKNKTTPLSDIDIAVFLSKYKSEEEVIPVIEQLEKEISVKTECNYIDITVINIADPLLRFQIFTTGKLILYKQIKKYYFEKAKSFSLYQDYQYLLDFHYKNVVKNIGS